MALNKEIDYCDKISSEVKNAFLQVYNTLKTRETQLLRQITALAQHYKLNESYDKCVKQVSVVFENENDILNTIANFGRINFNGLSCDSDVFKIEDYQKPETDHVSLFKYLEKSYVEDLNTSNRNKSKPEVVQEADDPNGYSCCDAETVSLAPETSDKVKEEQEMVVLLVSPSSPPPPPPPPTVSNTILECIEKQDARLCLHVPATLDKVPGYTRTIGAAVQATTDGSRLVSDGAAPPPPPPPPPTPPPHCSLTSSVSVPNLNCKCGDSGRMSATVVQTQNGAPFLVGSERNLAEQHVYAGSGVPERVCTLSMKQPVQVQHWMKQIISEPETEPAPTHVMEHSHIKVLRKDSI